MAGADPTKTRCPHCGMSIGVGAVHCEVCGEDIPGGAEPEPPEPQGPPAPDTSCPHCGMPIPVGTVRCDVCGEEIPGGAQPPPPPPEQTSCPHCGMGIDVGAVHCDVCGEDIPGGALSFEDAGRKALAEQAVEPDAVSDRVARYVGRIVWTAFVASLVTDAVRRFVQTSPEAAIGAGTASDPEVIRFLATLSADDVDPAAVERGGPLVGRDPGELSVAAFLDVVEYALQVLGDETSGPGPTGAALAFAGDVGLNGPNGVSAVADRRAARRRAVDQLPGQRLGPPTLPLDPEAEAVRRALVAGIEATGLRVGSNHTVTEARIDANGHWRVTLSIPIGADGKAIAPIGARGPGDPGAISILVVTGLHRVADDGDQPSTHARVLDVATNRITRAGSGTADDHAASTPTAVAPMVEDGRLLQPWRAGRDDPPTRTTAGVPAATAVASTTTTTTARRRPTLWWAVAAALVVLALVAGLLLAGGGDGDDETETVGGDAVTLAAWRADADAICAAASEDFDRLEADLGAAPSRDAYLAYLDAYLERFEQKVEELAALGAPGEGTADIAALEAQSREQLALGRQLRDALAADDQATFERLNAEIQALNADNAAIGARLELTNCAGG